MLRATIKSGGMERPLTKEKGGLQPGGGWAALKQTVGGMDATPIIKSKQMICQNSANKLISLFQLIKRNGVYVVQQSNK